MEKQTQGYHCLYVDNSHGEKPLMPALLGVFIVIKLHI